MNSEKLAIYYDGACPLCSREIDRYRRCRGAETLDLRDIADPGFDPDGEGLRGCDWNVYLHARTADGKILRGLDAFAAVWERLPAWRPLARLVRFPLLRPLASLGYHLFTRLRPLLPRRRARSN